jgi:hypothetical protein
MSDVTSDAYGKVFCMYIFLIEMRGYASVVLRYYLQFEMQLQLLVPFAFFYNIAVLAAPMITEIV